VDDHGGFMAADVAAAPQEWTATIPEQASDPEQAAGVDSTDRSGPDGLLDRVDQLHADLLAVRGELAAGNERASARERVIDRLHSENQQLRAGERQMLLRPLLVDLQRLRSDLLRQAAGLPPELPVGRMATLLESFAYSVELTLGRGGVEVVRPPAGTAFDPGWQRASGVLPAPTVELDGTVAEVVDDGYLDAVTRRPFTPATVRVYRWTSPESNVDTAGGAGEPEKQ
jgi:molecular chaperone GrpE